MTISLVVLVSIMVMPIIVVIIMVVSITVMPTMVVIVVMFDLAIQWLAVNRNVEPASRVMLVQRFKWLCIGRAKLSRLATQRLYRLERICFGLLLNDEIQMDNFRFDR